MPGRGRVQQWRPPQHHRPAAVRPRASEVWHWASGRGPRGGREMKCTAGVQTGGASSINAACDFSYHHF